MNSELWCQRTAWRSQCTPQSHWSAIMHCARKLFMNGYHVWIVRSCQVAQQKSEMPLHRFLRVDLSSIVGRCLREWRVDIFLGPRGLCTYDRHPHCLPTILLLAASNVSTDIKYQLNLTGAGTGGPWFQWAAGVPIPIPMPVSEHSSLDCIENYSVLSFSH